MPVVAVALVLALAGLSLAPDRARAQAQRSADTWFDRWSRELVVRHDGTFVETLDDELVVGVPAESGAAVQRALHWNASTGTIEVLEAATIKADGRRIAAPPEMMIDSGESVREGVFQDHRYRIITYVDLEPGERITLKAEHRRTLPFFDDHFFDDRGPPERPAVDARIVYDIPESMVLYVDAYGYALESVVRGNGRVRQTWRHVGDRPVVHEHDVVAATDYADRLNVSTMRDYPTLARAYLSYAYHRADPTPKIRALAMELTRGAHTDRARAQALFEWVRSNVSYGGDHLGAATVVPKSAQSTLDAREGDCKDQATLYQALLASVGITSSSVMINATDAYDLPSVPTLGVFNHVLTWIPSLQLFVDTTVSHLAFGQLPTALSDKPALIVKTGELVRTPVQRPLVQAVRVDGAIDRDGGARFTLVDTPSGWFAGARRRFFDLADDDELHRASEGMLYVSRLVGQASVRGRADPANSAPVSLVMTAQVSGLMSEGETADLRAVSSVGVGIEQALDDFRMGYERTAPAVCVSKHVKEHASWRLGPGLVPIELPGGLSISGHGFRYESRFRLVGQRLEISRDLAIDFERNVCTPEQMRIVQRLARDVLVDLQKTAQLRRSRSR